MQLLCTPGQHAPLQNLCSVHASLRYCLCHEVVPPCLCRWLQDPASKAWNVVVVAPKGMQEVSCPDCLFIHRYDGTVEQGRYQVLYQVMQTAAWDDLVVGKHQYLYFPEEGIIQDVPAIKA